MGPPMTATPAMSLPQAPAVRPNPQPTASPVCDPPSRQHPGLNSHTHTTDRRTERQPSPHDTRRNLPHPPHPHELTHPLSARLLANNSPAGTPNHSHPPHSESRHLRLTGGRTDPHSLTHTHARSYQPTTTPPPLPCIARTLAFHATAVMNHQSRDRPRHPRASRRPRPRPGTGTNLRPPWSPAPNFQPHPRQLAVTWQPDEQGGCAGHDRSPCPRSCGPASSSSTRCRAAPASEPAPPPVPNISSMPKHCSAMPEPPVPVPAPSAATEQPESRPESATCPPRSCDPKIASSSCKQPARTRRDSACAQSVMALRLAALPSPCAVVTATHCTTACGNNAKRARPFVDERSMLTLRSPSMRACAPLLGVVAARKSSLPRINGSSGSR